MGFSRAQHRIAIGWFLGMAAFIAVPPWWVGSRAPHIVHAFALVPPAGEQGAPVLAWSMLHAELFVLAVGMLLHLFVRERGEAGRLRPEELERLTAPFGPA